MFEEEHVYVLLVVVDDNVELPNIDLMINLEQGIIPEHNDIGTTKSLLRIKLNTFK